MNKFACNIAHGRNFCKLFYICLPHKTCMVACSAGNDINSVTCLYILYNIFIHNNISLFIGILLHNSADNKGLFLNFLKHEVRVCSLFRVGHINFCMEAVTLYLFCI